MIACINTISAGGMAPRPQPASRLQATKVRLLQLPGSRLGVETPARTRPGTPLAVLFVDTAFHPTIRFNSKH